MSAGGVEHFYIIRSPFHEKTTWLNREVVSTTNLIVAYLKRVLNVYACESLVIHIAMPTM